MTLSFIMQLPLSRSNTTLRKLFRLDGQTHAVAGLEDLNKGIPKNCHIYMVHMLEGSIQLLIAIFACGKIPALKMCATEYLACKFFSCLPPIKIHHKRTRIFTESTKRVYTKNCLLIYADSEIENGLSVMRHKNYQ